MVAESQAQDMDSLALKKKARRRLVGTIVLVILALILLPGIFKNKSAPPPAEDLLVLMPEASPTLQDSDQQNGLPENPDNQLIKPFEEDQTAQVAPVTDVEPVVKQSPTSIDTPPPNASSVDEQDKPKKQIDETAAPRKVVVEPVKVVPKEKLDNKVKSAVVKVDEAAKTTKAVAQEKPKKKVVANTGKGYAVQLGVFANPENVKKMQAKIALAGFESKTSTIQKDQQAWTRLRVGNFITLEAAQKALVKLQKNGLSGEVVSGQ